MALVLKALCRVTNVFHNGARRRRVARWSRVRAVRNSGGPAPVASVQRCTRALQSIPFLRNDRFVYEMRFRFGPRTQQRPVSEFNDGNWPCRKNTTVGPREARGKYRIRDQWETIPSVRHIITYYIVVYRVIGACVSLGQNGGEKKSPVVDVNNNNT